MGGRVRPGSAFAVGAGLFLMLFIGGCPNPVFEAIKRNVEAAVTPEINVKQGTVSIPDGTGSYGFPGTVVGSYTDVVFTIENLGSADLTLSGSPRVQIGGTDASQFSVTVQPSSPVAPSGTTSFTIRFEPTSTGSKSATLSIANNDSDENPYDFDITGTATPAPTPEINVKQGTVSIPDGTGSYDFPSTVVGSYTDVTFTIENLGSADLILNGSTLVEIGGTDASQFSVTVQPSTPVAPSGTTSFTIRFAPTSTDSKSATLSIANNDSDENPYDFDITGTATTAAEINVKQGTTNIPSGTGSYDFGSVYLGSSSAQIVFTIENTGGANLNLTGLPDKVQITGTDLSQFIVDVQPSSPVSPGGISTFTVHFSPTSSGTKTNATLSIPNTDSDENPYTFSLRGVGLTGHLDTTFDPGSGANDFVQAVALQADGKVFIGGNFTSYNGSARSRIARLYSNGSLDETFDPGEGPNNYVSSIALQGDGKVVIGGEFTLYSGAGRNRIARLNSNGSLDTTFTPVAGTDSTVRAIAIQGNGRIVIGGDFLSYNGTARNFIARLYSNGSLDSTFDPGLGASNPVWAIALQTDGTIIIGGEFTSYNGTARNRIARLYSNGSLDPTFDPGLGASGPVYAIGLQADGKIIIGGEFTSYNGTARNRIARLYSNGTLDLTFDPGSGADFTVTTTAVQGDDKTVIGGYFTWYNGIARNRIARLNSNGTLDTTFAPVSGASYFVLTTAIQGDGKILIGGLFAFYDGSSRNRIARIWAK